MNGPHLISQLRLGLIVTPSPSVICSKRTNLIQDFLAPSTFLGSLPKLTSRFLVDGSGQRGNVKWPGLEIEEKGSSVASGAVINGIIAGIEVSQPFSRCVMVVLTAAARNSLFLAASTLPSIFLGLTHSIRRTSHPGWPLSTGESARSPGAKAVPRQYPWVRAVTGRRAGSTGLGRFLGWGDVGTARLAGQGEGDQVLGDNMRLHR